MTFLYNVVSTSMQRHDVASTLRRRCIDVMCLLGWLDCKQSTQQLLDEWQTVQTLIKCYIPSWKQPIQIYWKFYNQKMAIFQIKNTDIFHISAQNIDCGYLLELPHRGSSNKYSQSMFLSRNNKNSVYPCKPQFYYIKVGFKGVKII